MSVRKFGNELTNATIDRHANKPVRPIIISVEAAIGTGKSTLLRLIEEREPSWVVVQEPVDQWQNIAGEGHNLLAAFYSDLERYAFSFQTNCVLSRIEAVADALATCPADTPVVVLERSWFSDRHTFAEMLHKSGKISDMEWVLYDQWYQFAVKNSPKIDGHLYMECTTDTCMDRLRKRSRDAEVGVTGDYQSDLIEHHEMWLDSCDQKMIQRVNVDHDYLGDEDATCKMVDCVRKFATGLRERSQ